jgi:hypothetical protein
MSTSQPPSYQLLPTSDDSEADHQVDPQLVSDPNRAISRQPRRKFVLGVVFCAVVLLSWKLLGQYIQPVPKKNLQDKGNTTMPRDGKYSVG